MRGWCGTLLLVLCACQGNQGLGYQHVSVEATWQDGAPIDSFDGTCITLPVLLGSQIEDHFAVGDAQIVVTATRDWVRIRLPDASGAPAAVTISKDQISAGYGNQLTAKTPSGDAFIVYVASGCAL